jgi:hypothetical protein
MIIEANGIKLETSNNNDGTVAVKILEQSKQATDAIKIRGFIKDEQTGYTLRSNNYPAFKRQNNKIFLRGADHSQNDRVITIPLNPGENLTTINGALQRMVAQATMPAVVDPQHKNEEMKPIPGGTTHVRFAFITRSMAEKLKLTAQHHYPEKVRWDVGTKPILTVNGHYNEHISQGVDVLNKAYGAKTKDTGVVNPHRVTSTQAKKAVEAMQKLFKDAEDGDYLVALWRGVTSLRGAGFY